MSFASRFLPRPARLAEATSDASPAASRAEEARRALLVRIAEFVELHDLAVTASNLATICGGLSGSHPELAQAFTARERAGEPIDQWGNPASKTHALMREYVAAVVSGIRAR